MAYRYKKNQIFRKKLPVPKYIQDRIYACRLSLVEYIEYDLDGKIPVECISSYDRVILEKFGIDRCRKLDWELVDRVLINGDSVRDVLMTIDGDVSDINRSLYELVKNKMKPRDYTATMKKLYPGRFFDMSGETVSFDYDISRFNEGTLDLGSIVENWSKFKDKDISLCLLNDKNNKDGITSEQIKGFMDKYIVLVPYFFCLYIVYYV